MKPWNCPTFLLLNPSIGPILCLGYSFFSFTFGFNVGHVLGLIHSKYKLVTLGNLFMSGTNVISNLFVKGLIVIGLICSLFAWYQHPNYNSYNAKR